MQRPANKNATKEAVELLDYISDCAGKRIITGQHTQTVGMEEITYIRTLTGKEPKLRGFELLSYSPNINYDDADEACITEIYENRNTIEKALEWGKSTDGIVTFSFHWFSPLGGRDKSFYTINTDFDPARVLVNGTKERDAFFSDMDIIARLLIPFRDEHIPILWRPFHESDGDWFWWGSKGAKVASELYKLMYHYYVDEWELDNLLWVWNCRLKEGYPGDEYVDIITIDEYLLKKESTDYKEQYMDLVEATTKNKVAALAEIGYLPDINKLESSHVPFAYYMTWSKEYCIGENYNSKESLVEMYSSDYAIKL